MPCLEASLAVMAQCKQHGGLELSRDGKCVAPGMTLEG